MTFTAIEIDRYARHLVLREIGGPGQQRLKAAKALVVGVGGLGGPAALYLAAAGVGVLGLVDADEVSLSNLQRQTLFSTGDVGQRKVDCAAAVLNALNPHIHIERHGVTMKTSNADQILEPYDLVIDATDNFETRFAVNAACVHAQKPLVYGALGRWTGQVGVSEGRPCYACLVPEAPPDLETCQTVGVLGALAGVVGSMMAVEAVKIITGAGETLAGRLLIYDALSAQTRTAKLAADPHCLICSRRLASDRRADEAKT